MIDNRRLDFPNPKSDSEDRFVDILQQEALSASLGTDVDGRWEVASN
jgi:hypothetical protein